MRQDAVYSFQLSVNELSHLHNERLLDALRRIEAIGNDRDSPTFDNTIHALEIALRPYDGISSFILNMSYLLADDSWKDLAESVATSQKKVQNAVLFNTELHARMEYLHSCVLPTLKEEAKITYIQVMVDKFRKNGIHLSQEKKARLQAIDETIAALSLQFLANVQSSVNHFKLRLTDEADLAGLPLAARSAASSIGEDGESWQFTLRPQSYAAFMGHSRRADLREKMWRAYTRRGSDAERDNTVLSRAISRLRRERAQLLGFPSYADFVLSERMVRNPETLQTFLRKALPLARSQSEQHLQRIAAKKQKDKGSSNVDPWDLRYYQQRLMEQDHSFDEVEVRPYLQLTSVLQGLGALVKRLFGLSFTWQRDCPVYHDNVMALRCMDADGTFKGWLYLDLFTRPSKSPGAWCSTFQKQWMEGSKNIRPHVLMVCNFRGALADLDGSNQPYLSIADVKTLLHETGHALHCLLSDVPFSEQSCTAVCKDFVEFPSMLMENFLSHAESLKMLLRNAETGEPVSDEIVAKIQGSIRIQQADDLLFHLRYAKLDLLWHGRTEFGEDSLELCEERELAEFRLLPAHEEVISNSFIHIFGHSYAAGFYSYKWSEFLAREAFQSFTCDGRLLDDSGRRLRKEILKKGGTVAPEVLFQRFLDSGSNSSCSEAEISLESGAKTPSISRINHFL